jgi:cellulose synthase/poly-beta-1,6-N-acetylglucosamine synthase-like glycosyltransferase
MVIPFYLIITWAYTTIIMTYWKAWRKVTPFRAPEGYLPDTRISVIVPARNEASNIGACVRFLLGQQYPPELFEVIVVDDFSTDATAQSVLEISDQRLSLLALREVSGLNSESSSKKKALAQGIARAKFELIVTTDADCICPPLWLHTLAAWHASTGSLFLAAPVRYQEGHGLLQVFQSLDFMTLQGITIAAASNGMHVMSNGANLGYEKAAFERLGGFEGVDHIASGDDMLLQQKFLDADPTRVSYCTSSDAIVTTKGAASWSDFLQQRIRWASKARHYKNKGLLLILVVVYLFNFTLLLMPFLYFNSPEHRWTWLALLVFKTLVELAFLYPVARFFGRQRLLIWLFPLQPLHILYTLVAGTFGQFRTYSWKGRKVK